MTVTAKQLANLKPIKPGEIRNPGGKPVGSRNRLQGDFMRKMADDFEKHGKKAIETMREEKPAEYIRAIASLMPKELEISHPLDDLSDEQLNAAVIAARAILAAQDMGAGIDEAAELQPAKDI
jgi:hypothetical protein